MTALEDITFFVNVMGDGEFKNRYVHAAAEAVLKVTSELKPPLKTCVTRLVRASEFIGHCGYSLLNLDAFARELEDVFVKTCWRCKKHEYECPGSLMTDGARDKLLCGGCLDEIGPPSRRKAT